MAVTRDRPYTGSNFLVDLGLGDPRAAAAGFSEVVFPSFAFARSGADGQPSVASSTGPLILRRGFGGALDLATWWMESQRGEASRRRTATVELLDDDGRHVVMTWRFHDVRPLRLSYAPLNANEVAVLVETLELAFDRVEMR